MAPCPPLETVYWQTYWTSIQDDEAGFERRSPDGPLERDFSQGAAATPNSTSGGTSPYFDGGVIIQEGELAWTRENLPNLKTVKVGDSIHFVQEDDPHAVGQAIAEWYKEL